MGKNFAHVQNLYVVVRLMVMMVIRWEAFYYTASAIPAPGLNGDDNDDDGDGDGVCDDNNDGGRNNDYNDNTTTGNHNANIELFISNLVLLNQRKLAPDHHPPPIASPFPRCLLAEIGSWSMKIMFTMVVTNSWYVGCLALNSSW